MKIHVTDPIFIIAHHIISSAFAQMLCQLSVYTYLRFIQVHVYVLYLHIYNIYIYINVCVAYVTYVTYVTYAYICYICVCVRALFLVSFSAG